MKGSKYLVAGALALATLYAGCRPQPIELENVPGAESYSVKLHPTGNGGVDMWIFDSKNRGEGAVYAKDIDGDGEVDRLRSSAKEGSDLEKLASFAKVNKILAKAKKEH